MAIKANTLVKTAILCCLVWLAYANTLHGPFEFDDWHVIPENPSVRGPSDVPRFFTDVSTFSILPGNRDYRPLFLTSMALSWWVGNGSTWPFHVVSITLHMGCVLLVFFVLRRLLATSKASAEVFSEEEAGWAGFLGAALFAVHPLATEAVTYISSQSVPMAAFFYLLAFMLFLGVYSSESAPVGAGRWLRVGGASGSYFLALLSKPIAITFPVILLLWEILLGRDADSSNWKGWPPQRLWYRARKHVLFAAVTLIFLYLRSSVAGNPVSATTITKGGSEAFVHYLTQTKALALYYLRLALIPIGQNHDIEYPFARSLLDPWFLVAIAVIGTIGWLLFRFRRQRVLVFWTLWFPTCLLVTTYLIQLLQRVREARMYLSLVGVCAVVAILLVMVWRSLPISISDSTLGRRSGHRFIVVAVLVVILSLGTATVTRNALWSSELELWGNAARTGGMGTWRAHMNYALALENAGRADEALDEFEKAVEIGRYAWAYFNLGLAQLRRGMAEDGEANLRRAVELWPESPETHYHLAVGLVQLGKDGEAEQELKQAIALRDNYIDAYRSSASSMRSRVGWISRRPATKSLSRLIPARPPPSKESRCSGRAAGRPSSGRPSTARLPPKRRVNSARRSGCTRSCWLPIRETVRAPSTSPGGPSRGRDRGGLVEGRRALPHRSRIGSELHRGRPSPGHCLLESEPTGRGDPLGPTLSGGRDPPGPGEISRRRLADAGEDEE